MTTETQSLSDPEGPTTDAGETPAGSVGKRVLIVVVLTVGAVAVNGAFSILPALTLDGLAGFVGLLVLGELGFLVTGVGFLVFTGRGLGYLDLTVPSARQIGLFAVGGAAGLFVLRTALVVVISMTGTSPAKSSVLTTDLSLQVVLPVLIVASVLVVGPCEELLFRGVVQKYLDGAASTGIAIGVAALLFGAIHLPTLVVREGLVGPLATTGVLVVVGAGFGWLYHRTASLPVAMVAHGLYNAAIFATGYLATVLDVAGV